MTGNPKEAHTYDSRDNAGPWVHDDETPCPSYWSNQPTPPGGDAWWCTEHQQRVHSTRRIVTGNPIDLDALRDQIALAIEAKRATWVGGSDGEFDPFLADAAMPVIAPLIAELRQHRQLADQFYDDAQAITNKDPASLGARGALRDAASRIRAVQRGPLPPKDMP